MNIFGDTGHPWRLNKFVEYVNGSTNGADTNLLREYCDLKKLSLDDRIWLCYLHTCCNAEVTAISLFNLLDYQTIKLDDVIKFWAENKDKLVFWTDRIYVKNNDWFVSLIDTFMKKTKRKPSRLLEYAGKGTPEQQYKTLYKELCSWRYMGRYSTELMLEAMLTVSGVDLKADDFSWSQGRTMTSGLLHIMYMDDEAIEFDKTGKLPEGIEPELDKALAEVVREVQKHKGYDQHQITPKLCSWRKLFKQTRYGVYYIDRQLDNIHDNQRNFPELAKEYEIALQARSNIFVPEALGEIQGWSGVRKGKLKDWINKGVTGFERKS